MGQDASSEQTGCQRDSKASCCYPACTKTSRPRLSWSRVQKPHPDAMSDPQTGQCKTPCDADDAEEERRREIEIAKADIAGSKALLLEVGLGSAATSLGCQQVGGIHDSCVAPRVDLDRSSAIVGGDCTCRKENADRLSDGSSKGLKALCAELKNGSRQICCTQRAITILKEDGNIVSWGLLNFGGNRPPMRNVVGICATSNAFAAWLKNGRVITWGAQCGPGQENHIDGLHDVTKVYATVDAFAALTEKGAVHAWGNREHGGDAALLKKRLTRDVRAISSTFYAFAAVKNSGSVVTWGRWGYGGGISSAELKTELKSNVKDIVATHSAFAALKRNGSVIVWGSAAYGGNSESVQEFLQSGVERVFSSYGAFVALSEDGAVVAWGNASYGGDSSEAKEKLSPRVREVSSTHYAFAAIKDTGEVVMWGSPQYGGNADAVAEQLKKGVHKVHATNYAFAAEKIDGSIVTWGHPDYGGNSSVLQDCSPQQCGGLRCIYTTPCAFVAAMKNGSCCAWGHCEDQSAKEPRQQDFATDSERFWIIDQSDDYVWREDTDAATGDSRMSNSSTLMTRETTEDTYRSDQHIGSLFRNSKELSDQHGGGIVRISKESSGATSSAAGTSSETVGGIFRISKNSARTSSVARKQSYALRSRSHLTSNFTQEITDQTTWRSRSHLTQSWTQEISENTIFE